jgi:hypothetical protein
MSLGILPCANSVINDKCIAILLRNTHEPDVFHRFLGGRDFLYLVSTISLPLEVAMKAELKRIRLVSKGKRKETTRDIKFDSLFQTTSPNSMHIALTLSSSMLNAGFRISAIGKAVAPKSSEKESAKDEISLLYGELVEKTCAICKGSKEGVFLVQSKRYRISIFVWIRYTKFWATEATAIQIKYERWLLPMPVKSTMEDCIHITLENFGGCTDRVTFDPPLVDDSSRTLRGIEASIERKWIGNHYVVSGRLTVTTFPEQSATSKKWVDWE